MHAEFEAYVSLAGLIDSAAEVEAAGEADRREAEVSWTATKAKLANAKLRGSGAPPEVVQQQRDLVADLEKQIAAMEENLKDLQAA